MQTMMQGSWIWRRRSQLIRSSIMGKVLPEAEQSVNGTLDAFNAYAAVRARGHHLQPKPGDRLPLKGVEAFVVSSAGESWPKQ
jgi:hypothetical protein